MSEQGTVLVTGLLGGLGSACGEHLVSLGYTVLGWDAEADGSGNCARVDVTDLEAVAVAGAELPPLVGVVHCAGISDRRSIDDLTPAEFERVLSVNTTGTYAVARSALAALTAGHGTFVAIGSVAGSAGFRNRIAYSASKAAVAMMVKSMAIEWAERGVRAICISPGFVDAGMSIRGQRAGQTSNSAILDHTPSGRLVSAGEVATAVAFAISGAAAGITGAEIAVDGGFLALGGF